MRSARGGGGGFATRSGRTVEIASGTQPYRAARGRGANPDFQRERSPTRRRRSQSPNNRKAGGGGNGGGGNRRRLNNRRQNNSNQVSQSSNQSPGDNRPRPNRRQPGGGGNRPNTNNKRKGFQVEFTGWKATLQYREFISFINSHCRVTWKDINFQQKNACCVITVGNQQDAQTLLGLNGKKCGPKQTAKVRLLGSGVGISRNLSPEHKQLLLQIISAKYNAAQKLLDLGGLTSAQSKWIDFHNTKFLAEIGSIIEKHCREVESINFAQNGIKHLAAFKRFSKSAPNVRNLSFVGNLLKSMDDLDHIKSFSKLQEIMFATPGSKSALEGSVTNTMFYQHEVMKRFPTLRLLDQQPAQGLIKFAVTSKAATSCVLPDPSPNFYDSPETQKLVESFVAQFLQTFDEKRDQLIDVYHDTASFSITYSDKNADSRSTEHTSFVHFNRNTAKLTQAQTTKRLKKGRFEIVNAARALPQSKHQINTITCDAFVLPTHNQTTQRIHCTFNGMYYEGIEGNFENLNARYFHRTMVLVPPTNQKWPLTIVNDQLHIGHSLCTPADQIQQSGPILTPAQLAQMAVVVGQVCQQCGCDEMTARSALEQNNFDPTAAVQQVNKLKMAGSALDGL